MRQGNQVTRSRIQGLRAHDQAPSLAQGPSWSSINLGGAWKLLHHRAQRFFAPLLLSAELDRQAGTVTVHVTSDIVAELEGIPLTRSDE